MDPPVDHGFWLVPMVFQGSFMIFHGLWLVSMVFQGSFVVFHGFWLVSMVWYAISNETSFCQVVREVWLTLGVAQL